MKKHIMTLMLWLLTSLAMQVSAQLINANPDPKGEPWWVGGYEVTPETQARLDALPELIPTSKALSTPLPYKVDNSDSIYFRPIFEQDGGSCSQAAGVGYIFTYMVNRMRGLPADDKENQYPTHFTYNFLNFGDNNNGTSIMEGWDIISDMGVPNVNVWGGMFGEPTKWMSGYDKYLSALENRVVQERYRIDVSTPEGLNTLKHFLHNHAEGNTIKGGGIVGFSVKFQGAQYEYIPPSSEEAGKKIVTSWGNSGGHAMTIVGYNDSIKYNFYGEWEYGAVKVANSHGTGYPGHGPVDPDGFVYMPYRLLAPGPGSIDVNFVQVLKLKEEHTHTPKVTLRVKLQHESRSKINIIAGISENVDAERPTLTQTYSAYRLGRGRSLPMQGINDDPIEISLDVSTLLVGIIPAKKFFLNIYEIKNNNDEFDNSISEFTLVHHQVDDEPIVIEHFSPEDPPVPIENNTTTILTIDYDYPDVIPQHIRLSGKIYFNTKVIVPEGYTVSIEDNCQIFFDYDADFILENGSSLYIGNNVSFKPMPDIENKKFTIKGDAELFGNTDSHIDIVVESGGSFVVHNCVSLSLNNNAVIKIEDNARLCIHPDALLDVVGHSAFEISPEAIILPGCIHPYDAVPPSYKIEANQHVIWDNDYRIVRDIVIESSATLKLINNKLSLDNGLQIIVETGGLLEIDGSTLTSISSPCFLTSGWTGILVKGAPNLEQIPEYQGTLILKNGAILENVDFYAIMIGNPFASGTGGGIIMADDVIFRNNKADVFFAPYTPIIQAHELAINISYFKNCSFFIDDNFLFGSYYLNNISLNRVNDIKFHNCNFHNLRSNITYDNSYKGIVSYNSSFLVDNCDFKNLEYGIYAVNTTTAQRGINVRFSSFSNFRDIYLLNVDNAKILNNDFMTIPSHPTFQDGNLSCRNINYNYGLYIDYSTNYKVISNNFSTSATYATVCNIGIVARNTGELYNSIYANNFYDLAMGMGIQAIGKNRGRRKTEGLELRCNKLDNVKDDFYVRKETVSTRFDEIEIDLHGIRALQGNPLQNYTLAGNLFSSNNSQFINETNSSIDYHHHNVKLSLLPNLIPDNYSDNINFFSSTFSYNKQSCPIREISPIGSIILEMEASLTEYETRNAELKELIDVGDSEDLERRIDEAGPGVDIPLYQFLMEIAPFLSEDVLAKLAAKEKGFTNVMIRNVLVKSPQAPKLAKVVEKLDNRGIPLPPPMRKQIDEGLDYLGEKELLELEVANYKTQYDLAVNEFISNTVHVEEGWEDAPELADFISEIDDVRYQYMLAEMYFADGDYEQGMQLLNAIEVNYQLIDVSEIEKHNEYVSFYSLLAQYDDAEQYPWFTNLPEEALQELETYIFSSNRIGGKAIAILIMNEAIEYEEPIYYPEEITNPKSAEAGHYAPFDIIEEKGEKVRADGLNFKIYPNPGKDHITMQWCAETVKAGKDVLETEPVRRYIQIYNSYGFMVQSFEITEDCSSRIIQLSTWQTGNYSAVLNWGNAQRVNMPFVVVR